MSTPQIMFSFDESSPLADRTRFAGELAEEVRDLVPTIKVVRVREREDTQDLGATLAVIAGILGTAAVKEVAKGIATFLKKNQGAKIVIRRRGKVVMTATHLDSDDIPKLAEALGHAGLGNG